MPPVVDTRWYTHLPWRLLFWPWTWPCSDPFPRVVAQGLADSPEPWDRHLLASLTLSEEPRIVPAVTFYWVSLNVWFPPCPLSSVPRHKLPESWLTGAVPGRPCLSWFSPAPAGASLCPRRAGTRPMRWLFLHQQHPARVFRVREACLESGQSGSLWIWWDFLWAKSQTESKVLSKSSQERPWHLKACIFKFFTWDLFQSGRSQSNRAANKGSKVRRSLSLWWAGVSCSFTLFLLSTGSRPARKIRTV